MIKPGFLPRTLDALKANLLPGIFLQILMVGFLYAYWHHAGTRQAMETVAIWKTQVGYSFAMMSYVISSSVLPELLKIGFFQRGRVSFDNLWALVTSAPLWAGMGLLIDFFYRCQGTWFGNGHDWITMLAKVFVDQFLFSPLISIPLMQAYFQWRDARFRKYAFQNTTLREFFLDKVFPLQVAAWCIWIPGVALVYSMPPALQLPTAVTIQIFWVMVFTALRVDRS